MFFERFISPETADRRLNGGTGDNWYYCEHPACQSSGYLYSSRGTSHHWHRATDVGGEPGKTPLIAGRKGKVVRKGYDHDGFGHWVMVRYRRTRTGRVYYGFWSHMQDPSPREVGERVEAGNRVGIMGTSGNASGEHCHFEIRTDPYDWSKTVDRHDWIEKSRLRELKRQRMELKKAA